MTNTPPGTPFRGPGGPTAAWALESAVDQVAHQTGPDRSPARSWRSRRRGRGPSRRGPTVSGCGPGSYAAPGGHGRSGGPPGRLHSPVPTPQS
ncbi:MAG: molybdopterin cofactor-binding domain-containing protein, partial [Actinomycetota bacterium]